MDYARRMGVHLDVDGMGVLLQELVPADSAGVLFTADPITGNPWRFVLESCFGLARDLVASTGTADRFCIAWVSGEVLDSLVAVKEQAVTVGHEGIEQSRISESRQTEPSLTLQQATQIAKIGLQIDRDFRARMDVEWVMVEGTVQVVQARPLTALPSFFPHHLPMHSVDETWDLAPDWHFYMLRNDLPPPRGKATLPIFRDKRITERMKRYIPAGRIGAQSDRLGHEMDFHGHRYLTASPPWPGVIGEELESYLVDCERELRTEFLESVQSELPSIVAEAARLERETVDLVPAIEALLWAQEVMWDLLAFTTGPSQYLCHVCRPLLESFVITHLPSLDVDDLTLGHHEDLDPYWPHVLVQEGEQLARLLISAPGDFAMARVGRQELESALRRQALPAPFLNAFGDLCARLGLDLPWDLPLDQEFERTSSDMLRHIRNALSGTRPIAEIADECERLRAATVVRVRLQLAANPSILQRFERLLDWTVFWGPALNHRVLCFDVPTRKLRRLFKTLRAIPYAAGLTEREEDIVYFTVEDLKLIAATGDVQAGRRLLAKRKLEYERDCRLAPPPHLGKPPIEHGPPSKSRDASQEPAQGNVIVGLPIGPGRKDGIVHRVQTLQEGDDTATDQEVVVLADPAMSNNADVSLLFSLLLRVRGIVVPHAPGMWTAHISQIARECRVPVVRIDPQDLDRLRDGIRIELDGTRGTVSFIEP